MQATMVVIDDFFARNFRIIVLTVLTYMAMC
jgi:hypothetical protein